MTSFLVSVAALLVLLAIGVAIIVKVRGWTGESSGNPDRWESALADYRNLRNKGVLSDEEYRKIRTLVEPGSSGSVSSQGGRAAEAFPQRGDNEEHHSTEPHPRLDDQGDSDEDRRSSGEDAPPA
ncbi:hypothetical protein EBU58_02235 [bacterium]|jgi:hypothetical protein|nr:hypothetical protein [Pirellulales bacterium]NBP79538.1 hypothetical protein [bacterium]